MCATGSNDVVIDDVFVPAHRLVAVTDIYTGTAPGAALHDATPIAGRWCPRWRCWPRCRRSAAPSAPPRSTPSGSSQRVLAYEGITQKDKPIAQAHLGEARVRLRALRGLLADTVGEIETFVAAGDPVPGRSAARPVWRRRTSCTSRAPVIADLLGASGASAHFLDNPLQRIKRDVDVIAGHVVFDYDTSQELAGALTMGMPIPRTAMV